MKLVSFEQENQPGWGVVTGDGIVDMGRRLSEAPSLKAALAAGLLPKVRELASGAAPDYPLTGVRFLPTIPDAGKILAIGLNYEAHRIETNAQKPAQPMVFARFATSQVGHNQPLLRPRESAKFDFEGELAVIIGRAARRVSRTDALSYVAGYACFNDGSVRDYQRHTPQFTPGKNFHHSGAFGPWMTTADEIPDPSRLTLITRLNGVEMQHSGTNDLIFDVPTLIEYCSSWALLEPGDVIVTGTPSGVGMARDPQVFMKDGDRIEIEISAIGTLSNSVEDG